MTKNHSSKLGARIFKIELGTFLKLCEAVNTPRSQACYMMAVNSEWAQYLNLAMPDSDIAPNFADDYLVTEAMRKNPRLPNLNIDRKKVATETWFASEAACLATNKFLQSYLSGNTSLPEAFENVITKARSWIANVLGPLSTEKLDFVEANFRFGPGATSDCSAKDVVLSRKMVSCFSMTPGLLPYKSVFETHLLQRSFRIVYSSKVRFVPKDAKTDRPINIEPHANIYVQLGIGALLRRCLLRVGIDLRNQADKNQILASLAHVLGLSTIDLSSASDMIAFMLVQLLFPPDWFELLVAARTPYAQINGDTIRLQKFSSMGNGFTFELETLIFTALARACGDSESCSFGDDIICRRETAPLLISTLNLLGFKVNERKTFLAGRFFESCGADFYDGRNIRPLYFRGKYADITSVVIRTCNKLRIYAHRRNLGLGCDSRFLPAWLFCLHRDSLARRTAVPLGAGNEGLIRNFDEASPTRARNQHEGFNTVVWRALPARSTRTDRVGAYMAALVWGTTDDRAIVRLRRRNDLYSGRTRYRSRIDEDERGSMRPATLARQLVTSWPEPGPWC